MTACPTWTIICDGEEPDPSVAGQWQSCTAWVATEDTAPAARAYAKRSGWVRRFLPALSRHADLCRDCKELQRFGGDKPDSEAVSRLANS